jgi:hypothetical protein
MYSKIPEMPGRWLKTISGQKVKMTKPNSQIPCIVCGEVAFLVNGTCSHLCQDNRSRFERSHVDSTACQSNSSVRPSSK